MTRTQPGHLAASRLLRYLAIPACCGALALTMAAASPASVPASGSLTPVATIPVGQNPTGLAEDPATGTVYVTCTGPSPDVYAIDAATNTVTATIPVAADPEAVTVNQITDTVYVAGKTSGTVSVIDGTTNTVTATIEVAGAYLVAADTGNNTVFAADSAGLSIIDGATGTVTSTVSLPGTAVGITVNPATKRLYVGFRNEVEVLAAGSGKLLATITTRYELRNVIVDPQNNVIYIAYGKFGVHYLEGVSGATNQFLGHIRMDDGTTWIAGSPVGLAVDQRTDRIYVTDRYRLMQVSGKTFRKPGTATVTVNALPVAVDPQASTVYVARYGSPNVFAYHSTVS